MAVEVGDGSLEKTLQKATDVSSYLNTTSALVSSSGFGESPKPSISATKAGISFVIPKNKLSGALVPVMRNVAGKWEPNDVKEGDFKSLVPQRKTKWGFDLTQDPAVKRGRALALQTRAEQIAAQLEYGQLDIDTHEATRSPSPPPIYDSNGQRTNTREGRRREQLELERREAIGECLQLNPFYKPPSGYKPVYKEAKLYIPVKDYPGYNFIGLILGPRGNTQKRMEAETGSRIAIRGKGAVKEGKKSNAARLQGGRRDGKEAEGAYEDLHVHITADSVEKVDAAVALVEPLLTPVDEDRNTHKRKQLRELAEMNGTMRDFYKACGICGENSHREWHCPKDKLITFQAKIDCQICRDGGHPTIDCPRKAHTGQGKMLDKEYLNFLEELGDGLVAASGVATAGLSAKLGGEDSTRTKSHPVPTTTSTHLDDTDTDTMSHLNTSLDPNQLVDVIGGPQPSTIARNPLQHMPTPWPPGNTFINTCEGRNSLQGGHAQSEAERQFPGMFHSHPAQLGFNGNPGNFTQIGFPHASVPSTYHGHHPSSAVPLNIGGLPSPHIFHAGPDRTPTSRSHFYGDTETGPGSFTYPIPPMNGGHMRRPVQMHSATSKTQANPWNQTANSQKVGADNAPMFWESNQHPRHQTDWGRGFPTQPPYSSWQMTCEKGWKEQPPAIPPPSLAQSPPWDVVPQKPWEATSTWNPSCLPTGVSQQWHFTQQGPLNLNPPQPSAPSPGSGSFVWRAGHPPQSLRMPLPGQPENLLPPPPNHAPRPRPPHEDPFPSGPWHSHSQPIPESNKFLTNPVNPPKFTQTCGVGCQPLPPATTSWVLQQPDDLCAPDFHPPPPPSSNTDKYEAQSKVIVSITPSSAVGHESPSCLNELVVVVGSTQASFPALPKTEWIEQGSVKEIARSPSQDSKPARTTPASGSPVEVDAEYERLMACVGVT